MSTLDKLKELSGRNHWTWQEETFVRKNALAALLAVVEAGEDLAVAVREWAQELNNTTINDCDVLAIRFQEAHARLQKEEKCDGRTV